MRVLIAGGGTGGHIYPALAVARSLRARPDAAELSWLGGHRGLEASLVPGGGHPVAPARAALAADRGCRRRMPCSTRCGSGASVPQAAAILAADRPDAIFTTGGYVAVPVLLAAAPLGIPVVLWEGNVDPGSRGPGDRPPGRRPGRLVRGDVRGARRPAPGRPCYVTGTPDPRHPRDRPRRPPARDSGVPPGLRVLLIFGGSQAVRRFNGAVAAALPRLVERVAVIHVTGEDGYAAALAAREALPADRRDRYRPHPFLRDDMLAALAAADLVVGRAGSSTLAEVTALGLPMRRRPVPACRRSPAGQCARSSSTPERPAWSTTRRSTPTRCSRPRRCSTTRRRTSRWPPRRGRSAGPASADAVADLVLAVAAPRAAARPSRHRTAGARRPPRDDDARRSMRSRSGRTSSAASGSRPRATSRWRASRRCASAARPTCSRRSTTSSSCAPSSGSRARARSRTSCSGGGATSSSATAGFAAS